MHQNISNDPRTIGQRIAAKLYNIQGIIDTNTHKQKEQGIVISYPCYVDVQLVLLCLLGFIFLVTLVFMVVNKICFLLRPGYN